MPLRQEDLERLNDGLFNPFRPSRDNSPDIERYKQQGGRCCLFCGNRNLIKGRWDLDDSHVAPTQSVRCLNCDRVWVDQYEIARVIMRYENEVPQASPVTVDWNPYLSSTGSAPDFRVESDRVNENVGLVFDANDEPY